MEEIILLSFAAVLAMPFLAVYKIKKNERNQGIALLAVFACIALFCIFKSGLHVHTGAFGNRFTYKYHGTSSMGSCSEFYIDDSSILVPVSQLKYGLIPNYISYGYRFKAIKSGECDLIVWQLDCSNINVYHITVDENLKCSYTYKNPETIYGLELWQRTKAFRFNGEEYAAKDAYKIYKNMIRLYGENKECEKPSEDYPFLEIEAAIDYNDPPNTEIKRYYIKDENTFYYETFSCKYDKWGRIIKDENGNVVRFSKWIEFTKDPQCKNSLLDVWEKSRQRSDSSAIDDN